MLNLHDFASPLPFLYDEEHGFCSGRQLQYRGHHVPSQNEDRYAANLKISGKIWFLQKLYKETLASYDMVGQSIETMWSSTIL